MPTALRRIRRERLLTQTELGDALGVGQTTISLWEAGGRKPRASLLRALESYLGLERTVLFALEDDEAADSSPEPATDHRKDHHPARSEGTTTEEAPVIA